MGAQEKTDKPNLPDKRWNTDKQGAAGNTALAMRGVSWGDNEPPIEPPAHGGSGVKSLMLFGVI